MARSETGTASVSADVGDRGLRPASRRLVLRDGSSVIGCWMRAMRRAVRELVHELLGQVRRREAVRAIMLFAWLDRFAKSASAGVDRLVEQSRRSRRSWWVGIARCLPVREVASAGHGCGGGGVAGSGHRDRATGTGRGRAQSVDIERLTSSSYLLAEQVVHPRAEPAGTDNGRAVERRRSERPDRS